MLKEVILKTWQTLVTSNPVESNAKGTYTKIYYPHNASEGVRFGAIRKPYQSYFGKPVLAIRRRKYGKLTAPDEFSVHTFSGVWLFNIHESWISVWTGREFPDVVARPYKPLRTLRPVEPTIVVPTSSVAASGAMPQVENVIENVAASIIEVQHIESMGDNLRRLALQLEFNELWDSISPDSKVRLADIPHDDEMSPEEKIAFVKADQATKKVEHVIPKQDFSNFTFEQLFDV